MCTVAGVDTLVRKDANDSWMKRVSLIVQDEAHHVLRENKWGYAASLFPNAKGLYPTATPTRADGKGLGRHADGLMDVLIQGPSGRYLVNEGYLTDYRIFAPPSDLDLSTVTLSAGGDYSPPKLRNAVHKSHIMGDVVSHYLKLAPGKLGVTFAVDIEAAIEIAQAFKQSGVCAEVISSKTPDVTRHYIMRRFRNREILQLVNVDLLGEGVDVPAIEVVSMARPTCSFALFSQQFGRALRPLEGKDYAIIIDHVGNVVRHGLPDAPRIWTLDRQDRRTRSGPLDVVPVRACLNIQCMLVYERTKSQCPYCGFKPEPAARSAPEFVDGDLCEMDPLALAKLRGEIERIDRAAYVPQGLISAARGALIKNHSNRQEAQQTLRDRIALWAGYHRQLNKPDSEIYRLFYFLFGTDVMTAQTLNSGDASALQLQIEQRLAIDNVDNRAYTEKL